jgi:hypothetical protein
MNKNQHAAKWWADQLRHYPTHNVGNEKFNEEARLMMFLGGYAPIPEEDIQKFEQALLSVIEERQPSTISVDYNPDALLDEAEKKAGINLAHRLPAKTTMWLEPDALLVSQSYGAQPTCIYASIS